MNPLDKDQRSWLKIDSAPKDQVIQGMRRADGHRVLKETWFGSGSETFVFMRHCTDGDEMVSWQPTHWRPLERS
jgi:hypothetical protein